MITLCLAVTPDPGAVQERGWILDLLRPAEPHMLHGPLPKRWVRLPRRFACKRYAVHAMRREIRTGAAVAAKLYWGGELKGYWQKCPTTGRERKMIVADELK